MLEWALLEALLDLVDRHWNGCKSLHDNQAFLGESDRCWLLSRQQLPAVLPPCHLGLCTHTVWSSGESGRSSQC